MELHGKLLAQIKRSSLLVFALPRKGSSIDSRPSTPSNAVPFEPKVQLWYPYLFGIYIKVHHTNLKTYLISCRKTRKVKLSGRIFNSGGWTLNFYSALQRCQKVQVCRCLCPSWFRETLLQRTLGCLMADHCHTI